MKNLKRKLVVVKLKKLLNRYVQCIDCKYVRQITIPFFLSMLHIYLGKWWVIIGRKNDWMAALGTFANWGSTWSVEMANWKIHVENIYWNSLLKICTILFTRQVSKYCIRQLGRLMLLVLFFVRNKKNHLFSLWDYYL